MQIQTELRPMFSYSIIPIILLLFLLIFFLFFKYKRKNQNEVKKPNIVIPNKKDLNLIKSNYLQELQILKQEINNNKINNRHAYQKLSKIIRNFIFEATNIKVQNYTLKDIKTLNLPFLYELVSEFYNPEFSQNEKGNIMLSIEKTTAVITQWK